MGKLRLLILRRYLEDVTAALGEFGGVHLVEPSDSRLAALDARTEISQLDALLSRCDTLLARLGVEEGGRCGAADPDTGCRSWPRFSRRWRTRSNGPRRSWNSTSGSPDCW